MSLKKNDFSQFLAGSYQPYATKPRNPRARITPNQSSWQGLANIILQKSLPQTWYAFMIWSIRIPDKPNKPFDLN